MRRARWGQRCSSSSSGSGSSGGRLLRAVWLRAMVAVAALLLASSSSPTTTTTFAGAFRVAAQRVGSSGIGGSARLVSPTHAVAFGAAALGGSSGGGCFVSWGRGGVLTCLQMAAGKSTSSGSGGSGSSTTATPRRRREFKTLVGETEYEEIIKKSRFLTRAAPAANFQDAQAFLHKVSDPKATHNCWAWRGQGEERSSDDGEPGGTAGRPMLGGIESEGLMDVMVVVTRYFGGVKLGAGGLVRAYGGVTRNCLRAAETVTRVPRALVRVKAPLSLAGAVFQTITRAGGDKAGEDYTPDDVIVDARLEYTGPEFMDELKRLVRDATKGAGSVEEVEEDGDG